MKADVKEKWLTALRSGQYRQTQEFLVVEEAVGDLSYCCLGVLCDLAAKEGVAVKIKGSAVMEQNDHGEWVERDDQDLPMAVVEWAGLGHRDPRVGQRAIPISQFNDGSEQYGLESHNFEAIAGLIERHL